MKEKIRKCDKRVIKLFMIVICLFLTACGRTDMEKDWKDTEVKGEDITEVENTDDTEKIEESIYEEKESYFLVKDTNKADKTLVDGEKLTRDGEVVNQTILLGESIDLYAFQKCKVGYTKTNVECYYESEMEEWSYIIFEDGGFFVLTDELKAVAEGLVTNKLETENSEVEITITEESTSELVNSQSSEEKNPLPEEEVISPEEGDSIVEEDVITNDSSTEIPFWEFFEPMEPVINYTEEEVIEIVRNTLEEGGMVWTLDYFSPEAIEEWGPDLGMSWGMDWVPMDDPQTYASSLLEGFQYQGFDLYYIEYLYTENGKVVLKTYFGDIPNN